MDAPRRLSIRNMRSAAPTVGNETIANRILLALPRGVLDELMPHLKLLDLERGRGVAQLGRGLKEFLFINRGMVSLIKTMRDGKSIELGAVGTEGIIGSECLFGIETPLFEAIVQVPGSAIAIDRSTLREAIEKTRAFGMLLDRYVHIFADQMAQTAACNRLHFIEQRCCRWLLTTHDSTGSDTFPLTQEFLAMMLGVNRPGVSIAAASLQKAGLIHYSRGWMTITDRAGLEKSACECYDVIREQFDRLMPRREHV